MTVATEGGIAMITSGFPRISETFALNELLALERAGAIEAIFATKPGDDRPRQPGAESLLSRVRTVGAGSARVAGAAGGAKRGPRPCSRCPCLLRPYAVCRGRARGAGP